MIYEELLHIIRSAAEISKDNEIIVVGSQAILGDYPNAPDALLFSEEADIYPRNKPEEYDAIDVLIGEGSDFHDTFGYYAQGISTDTVVLPTGWEWRVAKVPAGPDGYPTGFCISAADLFVSKAVAFREKDIDFLGVMVRENMVSLDEIMSLVSSLPSSPKDPDRHERVRNNILRVWRSEWAVEDRLAESAPGHPEETFLSIAVCKRSQPLIFRTASIEDAASVIVAFVKAEGISRHSWVGCIVSDDTGRIVAGIGMDGRASPFAHSSHEAVKAPPGPILR
ncbi:DUF6036 family nucleotidyltransferase [Dechloromonas sp. ARDL1]|uniref:DUF6036 family nucleotidyltransferase n=1 Tax=Dechloromonas sp. ARDL1 TaxID=3322121 RepID=UPI003DA74220